MSLKMTPQARLRDLENNWLAAELAVLAHPELPECMRGTARKAVERLEEKNDGRDPSLWDTATEGQQELQGNG